MVAVVGMCFCLSFFYREGRKNERRKKEREEEERRGGSLRRWGQLAIGEIFTRDVIGAAGLGCSWACSGGRKPKGRLALAGCGSCFFFLLFLQTKIKEQNHRGIGDGCERYDHINGGQDLCRS